MAVFVPVRTLEDLDSLSETDIIEGYWSAQRGDPEPGENRGRAFWHGWRNRMLDLGLIEDDGSAAELTRLYVERRSLTRKGNHTE